MRELKELEAKNNIFDTDNILLNRAGNDSSFYDPLSDRVNFAFSNVESDIMDSSYYSSIESDNYYSV